MNNDVTDTSQAAFEQALKIRLEQVKLLFEPTLVVGIGYIAVAIMLALMQWPVIDHVTILLWLSAMGLVVLWRLWLAFSFARKNTDWHEVKAWEKKFVIGSTMGGIVWGAASALLFPSGDISHQAVLFMVVAGMAAAGSTTLSALKLPGVSFVILITLPLIINLLLESTYISVSFSVLVTIFMLLLINSCLRNYNNHLQSITLRFEAESRERTILAADEKLRQTTLKLSEAQRIAHVGNWEMDIQSNRLTWSDEIYRMFEIDRALLTGSYEDFLAMVHPDDRQKVNDAYVESARKHTSNDIEHRLLFDDGRIKYVQERYEISYDEQGKAIRSTGTVQDISEYKQLEEQLLQAQKMEAIGTLVGGIAHDFNNILAAVQGNIYLALLEMQGHPKARSKLQSIERLSLRASDMVQQLLTFARKDRVQMKLLPLNSFMKEEAKLSSSAIPESIERVFDVCSEPLYVLGDITQLQQALMNLVNNACHALVDVPHPKIDCTLSAFISEEAFHLRHMDVPEHSNFAHITLRDNGRGIPPEQLDKIFEPFFTTKEVGEGTGLGLSMVYGAVKNHSGFIDVESVQGEGTTFHIYLPLQMDNVMADMPEATQPAFQGRGETILLVDDEDEMRTTIAEVLESLNYQVLIAVDGEDAVERFSAYPDAIDLVILDVVMPVMGGMDAARFIREINAEVPIIFATGYDRHKVLSNQEAPGRSMMLNKPFMIDKLTLSLRKLIEGSTVD